MRLSTLTGPHATLSQSNVGSSIVLRIHLSHDELTQQLDLLDLGERDLVAHLNCLKIANLGLVAPNKAKIPSPVDCSTEPS
jgi:hypothetical protein